MDTGRGEERVRCMERVISIIHYTHRIKEKNHEHEIVTEEIC